MVKVDDLALITNWNIVHKAALTTIGKRQTKKEIESKWKKRILLAEHSPIRLLVFNWTWLNIKSWISVHFVRHKIGIEHFVRTQRTDRTGFDRDIAKQNALVNHECVGNAQTIINISRKRLCKQASEETQEAWKLFLEKLKNKEPELYSICVPECVYRGFCPEFRSCGYADSKYYQKRLVEYRSVC